MFCFTLLQIEQTNAVQVCGFLPTFVVVQDVTTLKEVLLV
jgi:hypothetical protein